MVCRSTRLRHPVAVSTRSFHRGYSCGLLPMKLTLPNASERSSVGGSNEMPRLGRVWIFYICALVALPSAAHALVGAYHPVALAQIDPKLAPFMAALRYLGL